MASMREVWELQNREHEKITLEKKLKTLPEIKELKKLKSEIEESQYRIQGLKDESSSLKKKLKEEEAGISLLKEKISTANSLLYSGEITNSKELASAEKNVVAYTEKVSQAEERELALMEVLEENEQKINHLVKELDKKKDRFRQLNQSYIEKKTNLQQSLAEVTSLINTAAEKVTPELMQKYTKLCEKFDDRKGVALLENGICSGCHMSVSFDLLKQARKKPDDIVCDNCGRILVAD